MLSKLTSLRSKIIDALVGSRPSKEPPFIIPEDRMERAREEIRSIQDQAKSYLEARSKLQSHRYGKDQEF